MLRKGTEDCYGAEELSASYPIRPLNIFVYGQILHGYGESLRLYNQESTSYRFGNFALKTAYKMMHPDGGFETFCVGVKEKTIRKMFIAPIRPVNCLVSRECYRFFLVYFTVFSKVSSAGSALMPDLRAMP